MPERTASGAGVIRLEDNKGKDEMKTPISKRASQIATMLMFAFLSAFSAAATAVVPLIIHA